MSDLVFNFDDLHEFVSPDPGVYNYVVTDVKRETSLTGNPKLRFILQIESDDEQWDGGLMSFDVSMLPTAKGFQKQALIAMGWDPKEVAHGDIPVSLDEFIGRELAGIVVRQINPNTSRPMMKIDRVFPRDEAENWSTAVNADAKEAGRQTEDVLDALLGEGEENLKI